MRSKTIAISAFVALAGVAVAQTPSETINVGDIFTSGADGFFTPGIGFVGVDTSGLDFSQNFVAWRLTSDWAAFSGDPFSSEASMGLGDPNTFLFAAPTPAASNGADDGLPVPGLTFAGGFNAGVAPALPSYDVVANSGVFGDADFTNTVLELFAASDLPSNTIAPGALSPNAPAMAIDLGVVAIEGDSFSVDTLASSFDSELAVYAADGTLVAQNDDEPGGELQSQVTIGNGVSVAPDGSLSLQTLGAGEYILAVSEFDSIFDTDFAIVDGLEDLEAFDVLVNVNGVLGQSSIERDLANGIDNGIAFFSFTIAPIPAPASVALLGLGGLAAARRRR